MNLSLPLSTCLSDKVGLPIKLSFLFHPQNSCWVAGQLRVPAYGSQSGVRNNIWSPLLTEMRWNCNGWNYIGSQLSCNYNWSQLRCNLSQWMGSNWEVKLNLLSCCAFINPIIVSTIFTVEIIFGVLIRNHDKQCQSVQSVENADNTHDTDDTAVIQRCMFG